MKICPFCQRTYPHNLDFCFCPFDSAELMENAEFERNVRENKRDDEREEERLSNA